MMIEVVIHNDTVYNDGRIIRVAFVSSTSCGGQLFAAENHRRLVDLYSFVNPGGFRSGKTGISIMRTMVQAI